MSRTGLDAETLARSLRARAGDGSIEWDCEPIQTSVLLDVADMLAENAKLREEIEAAKHDLQVFSMGSVQLEAKNAKLRELVEDMLSCIEIRAAFGRPPTEEMYETFYKRARELGVDE